MVENLVVGNPRFRGIRVVGNNNVVRENVVHDAGGASLYENAYAIGIETYGHSAVIYNDFVLGVRGADIGEGVGVSVTALGGGTVVRGNTISNSSLEPTNIYR